MGDKQSSGTESLHDTQAAAYWLRQAVPMLACDTYAGDTIVGWRDQYHGWQLSRRLRHVTRDGRWVGNGGQVWRVLEGEDFLNNFSDDTTLLVIRNTHKVPPFAKTTKGSGGTRG